MASTSSSSSLTATSSTASPSATSSPDNGNGGGGYTLPDLFSSSGSPPLIVTFLAIGVFVIAMTGVFGWRRLARSRGLEPQPLILPSRRNKSVLIGKKPVLWDVWADLKTRDALPTDWENNTPMTAIMRFLVSSEQAPSEPASPGGPGGLGMLQSVVSAVKRFYFVGPSSQAPSPLPIDLDKDDDIPLALLKSHEMEWGDASSVEISVVVLMPGQGYDVDSELGEFCIGVTDVPWGEGG